nr:unnamed protein product [Callosobruchus chinensis]
MWKLTKSSFLCSRSYSLDERLLSCSDTVQVRQVRFHPGSVDHNHVLVLTSDNKLRLYQIQNREAVGISIFPVGEEPSGLFPGSKTPFLDIYGEIAVDFDFGHPEISEAPLYPVEEKSIALPSPSQDEDKYYINVETQTVDRIVPKSLPEKEKLKKKWESLIWPIYILRGDMTVYYMYIDLKSRSKVPVKGPIPLSSFDAEDNEACSLICLNTTPQIICIALSNGTICHSVALSIDKELHDQLKKNAGSLNEVPDKEMVVFESVELEMGLMTLDDDIDIKSNKYPIFLHKDELKPGKYFATHSTGVHMVTIGCADELQAYANSTSEDADPSSDMFQNPSKAEYIVCTKAASSEKVNPVIGFSIYYEPPSVIVLLGDGSVLTLGTFYAPSVPPIETLIDDTNSPLKKMLKEPFDQYIQKILKKASTQPVLKLSAGGERIQEQCYELLQRTAQIFREEHFKQHTKAREEIEKRVQTLTLMMKNQQKELERINKEKEELQEKASNLAEKYEDAKDKQDEIIKRCEYILMLVARKRSEPTEAEKIFMKECKEANEKIVQYWDQIEKIKKKMKYQQIQVRLKPSGMCLILTIENVHRKWHQVA